MCRVCVMNGMANQVGRDPLPDRPLPRDRGLEAAAALGVAPGHTAYVEPAPFVNHESWSRWRTPACRRSRPGSSAGSRCSTPTGPAQGCTRRRRIRGVVAEVAAEDGAKVGEREPEAVGLPLRGSLRRAACPGRSSPVSSVPRRAGPSVALERPHPNSQPRSTCAHGVFLVQEHRLGGATRAGRAGRTGPCPSTRGGGPCRGRTRSSRRSRRRPRAGRRPRAAASERHRTRRCRTAGRPRCRPSSSRAPLSSLRPHVWVQAGSTVSQSEASPTRAGLTRITSVPSPSWPLTLRPPAVGLAAAGDPTGVPPARADRAPGQAAPHLRRQVGVLLVAGAELAERVVAPAPRGPVDLRGAGAEPGPAWTPTASRGRSRPGPARPCRAGRRWPG